MLNKINPNNVSKIITLLLGLTLISFTNCIKITLSYQAKNRKLFYGSPDGMKTPNPLVFPENTLSTLVRNEYIKIDQKYVSVYTLGIKYTPTEDVLIYEGEYKNESIQSGENVLTLKANDSIDIPVYTGPIDDFKDFTTDSVEDNLIKMSALATKYINHRRHVEYQYGMLPMTTYEPSLELTQMREIIMTKNKEILAMLLEKKPEKYAALTSPFNQPKNFEDHELRPIFNEIKKFFGEYRNFGNEIKHYFGVAFESNKDQINEIFNNFADDLFTSIEDDDFYKTFNEENAAAYSKAIGDLMEKDEMIWFNIFKGALEENEYFASLNTSWTLPNYFNSFILHELKKGELSSVTPNLINYINTLNSKNEELIATLCQLEGMTEYSQEKITDSLNKNIEKGIDVVLKSFSNTSNRMIGNYSVPTKYYMEAASSLMQYSDIYFQHTGAIHLKKILNLLGSLFVLPGMRFKDFNAVNLGIVNFSKNLVI